MPAHPKEGMFTACAEWLNDWTQDLPPLIDEYDLAQWMEDEMVETVQEFIQMAFRKSKTRTQAIEIIRALLWELYEFQSRHAKETIPVAKEGTVERLLALPQTAQKSAAWHSEARELLTGHEFGGVVYGTEHGIETIVAKKCAPPVEVEEGATDSRIVFITPEDGKLSPFQWGWRYEQVIRTLFEQEIAKGSVNDSLGRIRHPTLPRLAASPDGLICDGPLKGRLVEIKAPFSRQLTGQIPQEYYCQMQLQAEVTDVEAVEYIEVRLEAQPAEKLAADPKLKQKFLIPPVCEGVPARCGCVLVISPPGVEEENEVTGEITLVLEPDKLAYAYSDILPLGEASLETLAAWKPADFPEGWVVLERSVWRVGDWFTTTVIRNRRWWTEVGQPAYEDFWRRVEEARASGWTKTKQSKLLIVDSSDDEAAE